MTQIDRFIRYTLISGLFLWPFISSAYDKIPASLYKLLPPYCQEWYEVVQLVSGKHGSTTSNWLKKLGEARVPLNHYCPALAAMIQVQFPYNIDPNSRETPELLLDRAADGVEYFINYNKLHKAWNASNKWLLAEAYSRLGDIESLSGHPELSIQNYRKAIGTFPKYIPAYIRMAKSFEKLKLYPEAIASLKQASKYKPKSKAILTRLDELEAKQRESKPVEPPP